MFIVEYASHPVAHTWHAEGSYREFKYADMIADWMAHAGHKVRVREVGETGKTLNTRSY